MVVLVTTYRESILFMIIGMVGRFVRVMNLDG